KLLMAKRRPLELTNEELLELETISRSSKAERRMVERANIILLWHHGKSFVETQQQLNISQMVVNKWRKRFLIQRIEGLTDAARSGKPPVYSAAQKAQVIQFATRKPKGGYTSWSQRRIAKQVAMSQGKVQQILKQADFKPHKVEYWCGKSSDTEFESKMLNFVFQYMAPTENALVLSVDE